MIAAITGHRPDKLGKFTLAEDAFVFAFRALGVRHVIQGMAPGGDLIAAKGAYMEKTPYTAVKPWAGHRESVKEPYWLNQYDQAWLHAENQIILSDSEKYVGPWLYHNRNKFMVDNADILIAMWNGDSTGGTASTVKYAKGKKKRIYLIDPSNGWSEWLQ